LNDSQQTQTGRSKLRNRLKIGVFWTLLGTIGHRGFNAIASVVVARILGPAVFGQYVMVHTTVQLFTAFAGFRLGSTSTKYIAEFRESDPARAGRILALVVVATLASCGLLSVIVFVMSDWLAVNRLSRPQLATPIAIGALYLFLMMVGNVFQRTLAGFEDFRGIASVGIVRGVASLLVCIPLAHYYGLIGTIVALVLTASVAAVHVLYLVVRQTKSSQLIVPFRWREMSQESSILFSFALPAMLTGFVLVVTAWQGRAMLMHSNNGDFELGVFSAADQFRLIVLFLPNAIGNVVLPLLSKSSADDQSGEFEYTFLLNMQMVQRIAMPAALFGIAATSGLVAVFGAKYVAAEPVIPVVMLAVFVYSLNQAVRQAFTATTRLYTNLMMHIIWGAVFIVCCAYFVPRHGAIGFAWVHVIADGILLLLQLGYVLTWITPIRENDCSYLLPIALSVATLAGIILLGDKFGITCRTVVSVCAFLIAAAPTVRLFLNSAELT